MAEPEPKRLRVGSPTKQQLADAVALLAFKCNKRIGRRCAELVSPAVAAALAAHQEAVREYNLPYSRYESGGPASRRAIVKARDAVEALAEQACKKLE